MPFRSRSARANLPSPSFLLLLALFAVLWFAGGASRGDVAGQMIVRGCSTAILMLGLLFVDRETGAISWPVPLLLLTVIALPLLQLVPLPASLWQSIPTHTILTQAVHGDQPWRPLAIQPDATLNAAASLIVPLAVLLIAGTLRRHERVWTVAMLLIFITMAMLLGLLQLSGVRFGNPFINDVKGAVSGPFANRNHFALLLALGCLVTPAWALQGRGGASWRVPAALGLVILFCLLILATGSRFGMALGSLGLVLGLVLARRGIQRAMRQLPKWLRPVIGLAVVTLIGSLLVISVATDRAQSVNRAMALDAADDLRLHAMPTVLALARESFPLGTGFGGFDTVFRMHEPMELLSLSYFNHAHNDFLEILLDGGAPALLVLVAGLGWWAWASIRVWRLEAHPQVMLGRLGSAIIGLSLVASVVDYPVRTPIFMALIMLASLWLNWGSKAPDEPALPQRDGPL